MRRGVMKRRKRGKASDVTGWKKEWRGSMMATIAMKWTLMMNC